VFYSGCLDFVLFFSLFVCRFLQLANIYFSTSNDTSPFDADFVKAVVAVIDVLQNRSSMRHPAELRVCLFVVCLFV
jgi:meiotically up-regulated gene 157 (Mug157) protein